MTRHLSPLHRQRQRRAFTLVEAVVASAIAAIAILAVLGVIVQLTGAAASTLSRAELARQVTQLDTLLEQDIATALPCARSRVGSVVRSVEGNRIAWTADPDGDGNAELVVWRLANGQLTRQSVATRAGCDFLLEDTTFTDPSARSTVLDGLRAAGPQPTSGHAEYPSWGLYAVGGPDDTVDGDTTDGYDVLVVEDGGAEEPVGLVSPGFDCTVNPLPCVGITGVRLSVTATTTDGTTVTIDRTLTFPSDRSRLTLPGAP